MGIGIAGAQIHSDRSGGAGGGAPTDATYVVVSLDASLSAERTLAVESGVLTASDAGANAAFTIGIATQGVGTAKIADSAVTYAKIQNVTVGQRLLGRFATTSGVVQEVSIGSNITLSTDGVISAAAGSLNFSTGQRLAGRFATTSGGSQEIIIGQGIQLTTDGTIQLAPMVVNSVKGNSATASGAASVPVDISMHTLFDMGMKEDHLHYIARCEFAATTTGLSQVYGENAGFRPLGGGTGRAVIVSALRSHPGIVRIQAGATTSGGLAWTTHSVLAGMAGGERYRCIFRQPTVVDTKIFAGYHDQFSGDAGDGVYFRRASGSGVIEAVTAAGGVRTANAMTTMVTGTWYRGEIYVSNSASEVLFEVYNSDTQALLNSSTITTNIPTATTANAIIGVFQGTQTACGTGAAICEVDYCAIWLGRGREIAR